LFTGQCCFYVTDIDRRKIIQVKLPFVNLLELILRQPSKATATKIAGYIGNDPARFSELVGLFLAGPYRITQRAAGRLGHCLQHHPELIKPHLKKILDQLGRPGIHDSVKRNIVRLLQGIEIPKSLQGKTADACFAYLGNPKEPIAVRVFSMSVLANLAKESPELKNEIIPLIEDQLPFGSAGFRSRGRKVLRELRHRTLA
jgi:hypothetical protein